MDKNSSFKFIIEGPNAEAVAQEVKLVFNEIFSIEPAIVKTSTEMKRDTNKVIDPIALAALIMAVPSTIIAAIDIYDRLTKKKDLDAILKRLEAAEAKDKNLSISIKLPDGTILPANESSAGKLLDIAAKSE